MKTTNFKISITTLLLCGAIAFTACNKEEEEDQPAFTDTQAVEAITESLQESTGGLAKDVKSMHHMLQNHAPLGVAAAASGNLSCGVAFDTTTTYTLSGSANGTFTHQLNLLLSCLNGIPQSLNVIGTHTGNYTGPNLTQVSQGGRLRTWSGLQPESEEYVLNGTANRSGTHTYFVGNQNTFNRSVESSITDLTVNKETGTITGGTGEATVVLTSTSGNTWTRECTIVFNGDGTATLTINGNVYTITLEG